MWICQIYFVSLQRQSNLVIEMINKTFDTEQGFASICIPRRFGNTIEVEMIC